ncbi:MAG TPA: asparagine synthase (glutamine-hydrolyzing) [Candidatus Bathyarchaeia archaeon]|nr:asparagine synthase (glutamine-hydrolyzing) [Candidatus Bathyarchaeia archaeon]
MCGIAGIFCPDGAPIDPLRVERMRDAMIERGPDAAGLSVRPGSVLGHRRLAILDLSPTGEQPMASEDGATEVVFNGEIYNFAELRSELVGAGCHFRSSGDTEVLLHGYRAWGIDRLLRRLRGMFAFALVDHRRHEIHLARDPLGEKPLFFRLAGGELAFASSARALAKGLPAPPEVEPTAIDDLLWQLYIPGPRTIFAGVEKLLPGRALHLGPDGRRLESVYWEPDFFHPEQGIPEEEWLERIEAQLSRSIARQLVADVPVGVMLSGGVDSGLVTALAARATSRVKTFSVATREDPRLDESRFAAAIARRYATDHHVLAVESDVRRDLPRLVAAMGEPMADSSTANLFAVAQVARRAVTVVLTGDGGDEAFGGYNSFLAYHLAGRFGRSVPEFLRPVLSRSAESLRRVPGRLHRAGTLLRIATAPVGETFAQTSGVLDRATRAALFSEAFAAAARSHDPLAHPLAMLADGAGHLPVDQAMQAHLRTILADQFLPKADLATMAASLEARCPFLDLDVIELAMRIPADVRFAANQPKGLLRKLARRLLPAECVDRPKQGFATPLGHWLKDWPDLVDDLVLGPHVERRGWFRRATLEQIVQGRRPGVQREKLLWALIVLEQWMRTTIDGESTARVAA